MGFFFKGNILIYVITDTIISYAMACQLWMTETPSQSDGIDGVDYLTLNSLNIIHTTIDHG